MFYFFQASQANPRWQPFVRMPPLEFVSFGVKWFHMMKVFNSSPGTNIRFVWPPFGSNQLRGQLLGQRIAKLLKKELTLCELEVPTLCIWTLDDSDLSAAAMALLDWDDQVVRCQDLLRFWVDETFLLHVVVVKFLVLNEAFYSYIGTAPPASNSHHWVAPFLVGNPFTPSFVAGILGEG